MELARCCSESDHLRFVFLACNRHSFDCSLPAPSHDSAIFVKLRYLKESKQTQSVPQFLTANTLKITESLKTTTTVAASHLSFSYPSLTRRRRRRRCTSSGNIQDIAESCFLFKSVAQSGILHNPKSELSVVSLPLSEKTSKIQQKLGSCCNSNRLHNLESFTQSEGKSCLSLSVTQH